METSWSLSSFLMAYILVPTATWGFWTNTSSPKWTWWLMEGRPTYFNRTLLLLTRPGPPRPDSLPMCLTTGRPTCGLPHRQTVILSTILCGAFWRVEVNSRPYNNKEALKAAIRDAMINMDRNAIAKACSSFQSCLEKVAVMVVTLSDFSTLIYYVTNCVENFIVIYLLDT